MELIDALNWRYATKKMNGQPVPAEKIDTILEATRLSATSFGLEPYNVIVVNNHTLKGQIHEKACPQPQIVEGSHVLIFAAWTSIEAEQIDAYIQLIADTRQIPVAGLTPFGDAMKGALLSRTPEERTAWATKQAYIALGTAMVAAATEQVDATPMEGFNADALDELLGLREKGLHSVVLLALGYRDAEHDYLANATKVRRPADQLFIEMA